MLKRANALNAEGAKEVREGRDGVPVATRPSAEVRCAWIGALGTLYPTHDDKTVMDGAPEQSCW
jgi:hypothetical protein